MKGTKNDTESSIPKEVITYAAAYCESKLAEIARNTNQPESELRQWVAIFLLSSWEGLSNSMSPLRRTPTKIYRPTRKMALVNNSHPKSQKKSSNSSHPVSRYWAKMTPAERSDEMQRRRAKGLGKKAA